MVDWDFPSDFCPMPEWSNWQTRGTQNPVGVTPRDGSTPSSGTNPTIGQDRSRVPLGTLCQPALVHIHGRDGDALTAPVAVRSDRQDAALVRPVVVQARGVVDLRADSRSRHGER